MSLFRFGPLELAWLQAIPKGDPMSDLSELFARDPLDLTKEDIDSIIHKYREHRAQYELGAKTTPAGPRKTKKDMKDLLKELNIE